MTAADVMDASAALLNDTAKSNFTYAAQLPYLNIALSDLQELFQQHNVPATNNDSAIIPTTAGQTRVSFSSGLPPDLIEIRELWESISGQDQFTSMGRRDFLPKYLENAATNQFVYWAWVNQEIHLPVANADIDLKLDYVKNLFVPFTSSDDKLNVIGSKSYLSYRTASLCSEFIGENKTRADALNEQAILAMNRTLGISTKGRQSINTRRRPFMVNYRTRNSW